MIAKESILAVNKEDIPQAAAALCIEEIAMLVELLNEKDDKIRYNAFLLLQERSKKSRDVYTFWGVLRDKLNSENSYQRSLGVMLLAENAKWDNKELLKETLPEYLEVLNDEKAITARQCIQSLGIIAAAKPEYGEMIAESLMKIDLSSARETMRKSILADIVITLLTVRKSSAAKQIDKYIENALSGSLLDKKTKKDIEKLLN